MVNSVGKCIMWLPWATLECRNPSIMGTPSWCNSIMIKWVLFIHRWKFGVHQCVPYKTFECSKYGVLYQSSQRILYMCYVASQVSSCVHHTTSPLGMIKHCVHNKIYHGVKQCKYLLHVSCATNAIISVHHTVPLVMVTPSSLIHESWSSCNTLCHLRFYWYMALSYMLHYNLQHIRFDVVQYL